MSILKIRDADGNVQEILAIKGEKGEKGDKGDPGDIAALEEHLGSAKEVFNMLDDRFLPFANLGSGYYTKAHEWVEKEGCTTYEALIQQNSGQNTGLLGKILKVKTYAYGDMACVLYGVSGVTYTGSIYNGFAVNSTADVAADPQSGVCEFELTVPNEVWGDMYCGIYIPFCENPYTDFEVYEKKGTVWEEIKNLSENGLIASGIVDGADGSRWYYRKWGDGFAECWSNVTATFRGSGTETPVAGEMAYANIPLPFSFAPAKWEPVIQCEFDRGQRDTAPAVVAVISNYDGSGVEVVVTWVESGDATVRCRLYAAGVCF